MNKFHEEKIVSDAIVEVMKLSPKGIEKFLYELGESIDEKYPNYEARYASTFLGKAAFEIGKIDED